MRAVVSSVLVLALALAARPALAQDVPPDGPGPQGPAPVAKPDKTPRFAQPTPPPTPPDQRPGARPTPQPQPPAVPVPMPGVPAPPAMPRRTTNVQIEVTITDQLGAGTPDKKTVSMIASDGSWGRIRTGAQARPNDKIGFQLTNINVDARPSLIPNQADAIQLELTIEYKPLRSVTAASGEVTQSEGTNLNQSMTVTLQNGKPLQISQAADPVTDRKILVEVKASIQK